MESRTYSTQTKPCPICGCSESMIANKQAFKKAMSKTGHPAISMRCERCGFILEDYGTASYAKARKNLISKWNLRARRTRMLKFELDGSDYTFSSCPICGKLEHLSITSRSKYNERISKKLPVYARVKCRHCKCALYERGKKFYNEMIENLRHRWNNRPLEERK